MKDTKRIFVHKTIKHIRRLLPWPTDNRVQIIFDAPAKFHYFHLEPIIKRIVKDERYNVTIIKPTDFKPEDRIPNVNYITFEKYWHNWLNNYDLLITTELERRPGWFVDGTAICMFHGAGAKMSYFKKPEINEYDVIFSVGPMTYRVQKEYVNNSVIVEEIGLPASDILVQDKKVNIPKGITINNTKPTLLYAPSWAFESKNISMDADILNELANINTYNVIIRPHPNLLKPNSCNGYDWNPLINTLKEKGIQVSYSKDHSIYQLLPHIDLLIGDISSVTFEFLIFNRPIILYMNVGVLEANDAKEFTTPLLSATSRLNKADELKKLLNTLRKDEDTLVNNRTELLHNMLFNIGGATDSAVKTIEKYAFSKTE